MKITKWITVETEVEVSVDSEDITEALSEGLGDDKAKGCLRGLNRCATFLDAMTDDLIAGLSPSQKAVIEKFLRKHADRYITKIAEESP